ncbi:uncharacterized protein BX664DRAFT_359810 [Halteromyces radiatus]|uniref:uncharacterized protein n=1 Tax=Halteromyces radiatus TaxID=101107 RepID=UPI00221F3144|nr:uncharacterized protein BX664DRAFT_359810 [Halteromyces radiatus]KAI8086268.1 hypothetical protein BX664DRAFT_359810 [Halteromyces radiatus]
MTSTLPFTQHIFYILPLKLDPDKLKGIQDAITLLDGTCSSSISSATFIITCLKSPHRIKRHVSNTTCPIIHMKWIFECVTQRRFLDPAPYRIHVEQKIPATTLNDDRPRQMRSWDDIYDIYRQQSHIPVSKVNFIDDYGGKRKKKKQKLLKKQPSYQTTTSGESSLEHEHPWWTETNVYRSTSFVCERPSPLDHPNKDLVEIFESLEHSRELRGDTINSLGYRKAAAAIKSYPYKIKSVNEAFQLKGIGKKTGRIVEDYLKKGTVPDLETLKEDEEFKTLKLFYNIHGVGATTAREWYHKGHRTLEEVKKNESLSRDQLLGIKYYDDFLQPIPRQQVEIIIEEFRVVLEEYQSGCDFTICGSYRRGKQTSGDVDILVTHPDDKVASKLLTGCVDRLQSLGYIQDILSMTNFGTVNSSDDDDDDTIKTRIHSTGQALCVWLSKNDPVYRRVDLIVVPWDDYPVAILSWTGSGHFNRSLRLRAKKVNGLKVTSHGFFRKGEKLKVTSERHAFELLDLTYLEPKDRNC